jgi:hypothetical protein
MSAGYCKSDGSYPSLSANCTEEKDHYNCLNILTGCKWVESEVKEHPCDAGLTLHTEDNTCWANTRPSEHELVMDSLCGGSGHFCPIGINNKRWRYNSQCKRGCFPPEEDLKCVTECKKWDCTNICPTLEQVMATPKSERWAKWDAGTDCTCNASVLGHKMSDDYPNCWKYVSGDGYYCPPNVPGGTYQGSTGGFCCKDGQWGGKDKVSGTCEDLRLTSMPSCSYNTKKQRLECPHYF